METTVTEVTVRKAGGEGSGSHNRSRSANGGFEGVFAEEKENDKESEAETETENENDKHKEKEKNKAMSDYFGWVYHLGTNSIGHEYCHLRFLFIRGKYVEMYKRDPHENPGIRPIRRGVAVPTMAVEDLGRRKVNHGEVYVVRFCNRLDETKKGEIACATAGEARKWIEAFDHAKQQAERELSRGGSSRRKLSMDMEINLEGHRPRVRRYAHELKKLIRIGQGPEMLLHQASDLDNDVRSNRFYEEETGDAIEAHKWRCVSTINGVRVLEDVSDSKNGKGVLVKAVGVIDTSADAVFEVILNVDRHQRYEWDTLTGDLELLDSYDGHFDIVYGTFDPKCLTRWKSKRDFVFSRQWFSDQDGTYTILQFPAVHKKRPPRSGYKRTKMNPSTWEIRNLNTPMGSNSMKCILTQTLEIHDKGWFGWKTNHSSKFEKTIPYALLSQVAALKEYIEANPALKSKYATTVLQSRNSDDSSSSVYEDSDVNDEFYDAISADSSSEEESDDEDQSPNQEKKVKLKNVSWAIASLNVKRTSVDANKVLDPNVPPINVDLSHFQGSLRKGTDEIDSDCWTSPSGTGFMIRGKTYLKDNSKVMGGDPLLKLVAVDWLKVDSPVGKIALHPKCLVQTEAGKNLPFILVINLQIPAKPNYSLVLYYAAERPVNNSSLLGKFIDGSDMFRDSRFKLIPSIIEGYWMVKRAVGTKACLLGKAVTCNYLRQDNFLEIDVDIGSSSVARGVIGLVLGYVTSLVVDLAILVEATEEEELPEFILGTVRLSRLKPESAMSLEV
ncbi:protein ENHANCED DISEASE RESISTANCE 2-like [Euphorbia lathyris]|uniref:protein ENHANCED DISEASE RESISTANCE 2-like n=1 Tax=Euphorbia lathyris TaxID=212925 RepID=UPI003313CB7A